MEAGFHVKPLRRRRAVLRGGERSVKGHKGGRERAAGASTAPGTPRDGRLASVASQRRTFSSSGLVRVTKFRHETSNGTWAVGRRWQGLAAQAPGLPPPEPPGVPPERPGGAEGARWHWLVAGRDLGGSLCEPWGPSSRPNGARTPPPLLRFEAAVVLLQASSNWPATHTHPQQRRERGAPSTRKRAAGKSSASIERSLVVGARAQCQPKAQARQKKPPLAPASAHGSCHTGQTPVAAELGYTDDLGNLVAQSEHH